ncbi:MAG TPA: hypothetical protein ENK73_02680 [Thiomicrospira sp.]|nr:hypothetical protein [Thiomicrospira sp.]
MTQDLNTTTNKEAILTKALTKILKPLVRLLIHQNITYVGLLNMLKKTYVEVAEESFSIEGKRMTDSRISLLTGVHRGEVKHIRTEVLNQPSEKELKAGLSAQLMSIWTGHQAYLNENNEPQALYRCAQDGSPSFEKLVLSVSKDKHPRSILDDWLHQGLVKLVVEDNKEFVILTEKGYVPEADFEEKLFFAGKNIGDHLAVVAHNLENQTPSMFDRAVYYQHLSEASIKTIEEASKEKMIAALTELNQLASQLQMQDKQAEDAFHCMHVGAYFHRKNEQPSTKS